MKTKKLLTMCFVAIAMTMSFTTCKNNSNEQPSTPVENPTPAQPANSANTSVPPVDDSAVDNGAVDNEKDQAKKAIMAMIHDVKVGKIERFNWLEPEEVDRVLSNEEEIEQLRAELENISSLEEELEDMYEEGVEAGIDWDDVKVTDIDYKVKTKTDLGCEVLSGNFLVESNGNTFKCKFTNVIVLDGEWRSMKPEWHISQVD